MGRIFDDQGKLIEPDALRSIVFAGAPRHKPKVKIDKDGNKQVESKNDETGKTIGFSTHHQSGRVDAFINVEPVGLTNKST